MDYHLLTLFLFITSTASGQIVLSGNASITQNVYLQSQPPPQATNYEIVVGQSLATGSLGFPALSTNQPYSNIMWNQGPVAPNDQIQDNLADDFSGWRPLVENHGYDQNGFADAVETMCSGFCNQLHVFANGTMGDSWITDYGVGGECYSYLMKNGTNASGQPSYVYSRSVASVSAARNIQSRIFVPAILAVHGECDSGSVLYSSYMARWQSDYQTDIKTITGQSGTIPLIHSQIDNTDTETGSLLACAETNKGTVVIACPKYMLTYVTAGTHLTNFSYRTLGEYNGYARWE